VPDCVVLDLQMPMMTGVELQEHLQRLADPPPVIIITAHDEPKTRERCLALGAVRYLRKPIEGDVLVGSIEEAVRGKRKGSARSKGEIADRP
jgi:CheY-like chemotaxis protein